MRRKRLSILTWHVHGNYLYYLTQAPHDWYVLSKPDRPPGYAGRSGSLPWGENVRDLPVEALSWQRFDCIVFQAQAHYLYDQYELLTPTQRTLPRIFVEHDPPQQHPTNTRHPADRDTLLVHVTHFNALMWDSGDAPTRVIEHGVVVREGVRYSGELERGIVVVNGLARRGRRLGADVFERARARVPLTLVGMESEVAGGEGEVVNVELPAYMAPYRFFFNPIRYTSLGLAVVEAMCVGLPIVALATTEMASVVRNGVNGYADTNPERLIGAMRELLAHKELARAWGDAARREARERFAIERFVADWCDALAAVTA
jgi:hypothetical protein